MAAKHWADTYDPAGALERAELDALDIVRDVSGSSAGLVFSLAILDAASPGRLGWDEAIAATGTISPHGDVLPVTKVHAKTTAVIAAGAERIYVHPDNAAAARRATWGHAIADVPVVNVDEAAGNEDRPGLWRAKPVMFLDRSLGVKKSDLLGWADEPNGGRRSQSPPAR